MPSSLAPRPGDLQPPSSTAACGGLETPKAAAVAAVSTARIVIVEDEPLNSLELESCLRGAGYSRLSSLSATGLGVDRLRDEKPDLLLIDLGIQPPDIFGLMQSLRTDRLLRHVPVLAMTALNDMASRLRALELGAVDVLVKPIEPRELELRLRNILAAKAARDELENTDRLTGLPNRDSALGRLDWAIKHALRHGSVGAALQVGIDRFKQVSDALGPTVGDDLLRSVAQRLQASLRDSDTLARDIDTRASGSPGATPAGPDNRAGGAALVSRGSGDEFTILLPVLERADDAAVVAQRILDQMARPFQVAGYELFVTCHIGMAVFPADSAHKDTVLKQAGVAMRHVGQDDLDGASDPSAGSGFRFYSEELNARSMQRLGLERELRQALERNEFVLHFQPQVDVATGRLCGAEALIRWQHPERGLVYPGAFISVAEDAGLIGVIGNWVLRGALHQLAAWRASGLALPLVSVNVSSLQFTRRELARDVSEALADAGVAGSSLCLELTESVIMGSGAHVAQTLRAIKALGVSLALDDFGTGYSSLSYLRNFPLDELKVDRSFVTDCETDANNGAITAAIIAMAHRLGLRVVAEGVETPRELDFVRTEGCDSFQGYLFARPLPPEEFGALLGARAWAASEHVAQPAEPLPEPTEALAGR